MSAAGLVHPDRTQRASRTGAGVLPPASLRSLRSCSRALEQETPATLARDERAPGTSVGWALLYTFMAGLFFLRLALLAG